MSEAVTKIPNQIVGNMGLYTCYELSKPGWNAIYAGILLKAKRQDFPSLFWYYGFKTNFTNLYAILTPIVILLMEELVDLVIPVIATVITVLVGMAAP